MEPFWKKVPGAALPQNEREWLKNTAESIARRFSDPVILNLGVWRGASMHCLRAGAPTARLVGIDVKGDDFLQGKKALRAEIIRGDVDLCWEVFDSPIHFAFFDADHRLHSMLQQLSGWIPMIVEGGIAAFHDYPLPPPRYAVKQTVDAWFGTEPKGAWASLKRCDKIKAFRRLAVL